MKTVDQNASSRSATAPPPSASPRIIIPYAEIPTEYGNFEAHDLTLWLDDFLISGTLTNRTQRSWSFASFHLNLFDNASHRLPSDSRFDGQFYAKQIAKGETKPIVGLRDERPASYILRPEGSIASFCAEFIPERSYYDSRTVFALVEPIANADLFFSDDWISIAFEVTPMELRFGLRNRTNDPLTILWDAAAYLDLAGESHRIVHRGVPLAAKDKPHPPTTIASMSSVDEMVYPVDLIAGSRVFEDWRLNPLMPLTQFSADYEGKSFGLVLPIVSGGQLRPYRFLIQLAKVVC
jgi:hypothetical protein